MSGFPPLLGQVRAASLVRLMCHRVYTFCVHSPFRGHMAMSTLGAVTSVLLGTAVHRFRHVFAPVGTSVGGGATWDSPSVLGHPLGDPLLPTGVVCGPTLLFRLLSFSSCQQ